MSRRLSKSRHKTQSLGGFRDSLAKVPKPVWYAAGAIALFLLFRKRKTIAEGAAAVAESTSTAVTAAGRKTLALLTAAEKAALKALVPAKGEEFIDLAFELAPKYGFSPLYILAFLTVESGFKLSPSETGDRLPRCPVRYNAKQRAVAAALPAVRRGKATDAYRKLECPDAYIPTTVGWGFGPMQLDWVSHSEFLKSPAGKTARGQMEYAIKNVIKANYDGLKAAFPRMSRDELLKANVAAYNAGLAGAIRAIKAGKPLDQITAAPWYIPRVFDTANKLANIFGVDPGSIAA